MPADEPRIIGAPRIAIDARPALDATRTGVGHYARQMIRWLPRVDASSSYEAWYLHARGVFSSQRIFDGVVAEHPSRFPARVFQPVSWRLRVPRLARLRAVREIDGVP